MLEGNPAAETRKRYETMIFTQFHRRTKTIKVDCYCNRPCFFSFDGYYFIILILSVQRLLSLTVSDYCFL